MQVARIKQTIKKVFDEDTFLVERIRTLLREVSQLYQGITIVSTLTALSMKIITMYLLLKVSLEVEEDLLLPGHLQQKMKSLKKMINKLSP